MLNIFPRCALHVPLRKTIYNQAALCTVETLLYGSATLEYECSSQTYNRFWSFSIDFFLPEFHSLPPSCALPNLQLIQRYHLCNNSQQIQRSHLYNNMQQIQRYHLCNNMQQIQRHNLCYNMELKQRYNLCKSMQQIQRYHFCNNIMFRYQFFFLTSVNISNNNCFTNTDVDRTG